MPIGTQKTLKPKPPDKGSFPLDHEGMLQDIIALLLYMGISYAFISTGECKEYMVKFLSCLKQCNNDNSRCREESKAYLQCRMDR